MMIMLAIEAMGEATALTESYGLKAADFLEVLTSTLFASPSYKRYGGNIAAGRHEPGFKLALGLKDVNLALEAARARNAVLPAADIVRENMARAVDQGLGRQRLVGPGQGDAPPGWLGRGSGLAHAPRASRPGCDDVRPTCRGEIR